MDGYVYVHIKKGMYGIKQSAILAYNHIVKQLKLHGYHPCPETTGLWRHKTRKTKFCLYVDDFGVKYFSKDDAYHLLTALRSHYKISVDYEGMHYCGFTTEWNYEKVYVNISMPKYITALLQKSQHPKPAKPQYAPHPWVVPAYVQHIQMATVDESKNIYSKGIRRVQYIVGSLLYQSRALDSTTMFLSTNLEVNKIEPQKNSRWLRHATRLCDNIFQSQNSFLCQRNYTSCRLRCSVLGPTQHSKPIHWVLLSWFSKLNQQHAQWCGTRHLQNHSQCFSFCS